MVGGQFDGRSLLVAISHLLQMMKEKQEKAGNFKVMPLSLNGTGATIKPS